MRTKKGGLNVRGLSWVAPKPQWLLRREGEAYMVGEEERHGLGTGVIACIGSARSGKTTLALQFMYGSDRDLVFIGFTEAYIEALPKAMRRRARIVAFDELETIENCICLLDDSALMLSNRDFQKGFNKIVNRMAGVFSHVGVTLILTSQSTSGIDIGIMRFCEMSLVCKRFDEVALSFERNEVAPMVLESNAELGRFGFDKSLYYSIHDRLICAAPTPFWLEESARFDEARKAALSKPFSLLSQDERRRYIRGDK